MRVALLGPFVAAAVKELMVSSVKVTSLHLRGIQS
jgi:hypothetical protein